MSPWNYPLSLAITDALPALMAGNCVVLRPDLQSPLCALAGVELLKMAGLPDGVLQVVLGSGSTIGAAVLDHTELLYSPGRPRPVRGGAGGGAAPGGLLLELGGKNSVYIADDADLARAVPGAIRACFSSAGQLCISTERLRVHDKIWDRFVPRFVAAVKAMKIGTALNFGFDLGSLASPSQLETVERHVADAVAHGATVLAGGRARPDIGPYVYEPTVLSGVTPQDGLPR